MTQIIKISILIIFTALGSACTDTELAGDGGDVDERQDTSETTDVNGIEADGGIDGECVPSPEICDGLDNDCDPQTSDGSEESRYQTECTPPDPNACGGYTWQCMEGAWVCEQLNGPTAEAVDITYDDMAEDYASRADIAWDGSAFVVGYIAFKLPSSVRVYMHRIDTEGIWLSDPEMLDSGSDAFHGLSIGAGGGESLAVWYTATDLDDWFLRYARMDAEGRVIASGNMPERYMFINKPEVARGTNGWLIVYGARLSSDPYIPVFALHLEEDGSRVGPPTQIGTEDTSGMGDSQDLGVVAADTGYGAAWRASPGVHAMLLSEDGTPQSPAVQITPHRAYAPAIGFDGTVFGVSWHEESGVFFRTLHNDGSFGCEPLEMSERTTFELNPSIVGLPGIFILSWQGAEGVETNDGLYQVVVDAETCSACQFSNLYCAETVHSTESAMARLAVAGSEPIVGVVFTALEHIWYLKDVVTSCE